MQNQTPEASGCGSDNGGSGSASRPVVGTDGNGKGGSGGSSHTEKKVIGDRQGEAATRVQLLAPRGA